MVQSNSSFEIILFGKKLNNLQYKWDNQNSCNLLESNPVTMFCEWIAYQCRLYWGFILIINYHQHPHALNPHMEGCKTIHLPCPRASTSYHRLTLAIAWCCHRQLALAIVRHPNPHVEGWETACSSLALALVLVTATSPSPLHGAAATDLPMPTIVTCTEPVAPCSSLAPPA